jgi:hypothetical protein
MTLNQLTAKLAALPPDERHVVESLVELLGRQSAAPKPRDLTGHPSFGAWSERADLEDDSDRVARKLRIRASRRGEL